MGGYRLLGTVLRVWETPFYLLVTGCPRWALLSPPLLHIKKLGLQERPSITPSHQLIYSELGPK